MSPSSLTRPSAHDKANCRGLTETKQRPVILVVQEYRARSAASRMPFGEGVCASDLKKQYRHSRRKDIT